MTVPGWNSVEGAARWHRSCEIAGCVALALLLIFEILAYKYGNRKDALLHEQDARIASDRKAADHAREQEVAAEVAAANNAAKEAKDSESRAIQKADEMTEKLAPRVLSKGQQEAITNILASAPKGNRTIKVSGSAPDATSYATQISDTLKRSGWIVKMENAMFFGPHVSGMWILVRNPNDYPPARRSFPPSICSRRHRVRGENDPSDLENTTVFWLCIGFK